MKRIFATILCAFVLATPAISSAQQTSNNEWGADCSLNQLEEFKTPAHSLHQELVSECMKSAAEQNSRSPLVNAFVCNSLALAFESELKPAKYPPLLPKTTGSDRQGDRR